ncbi:hypothetical protein ABH15_10000 [Methanoculleus taiwanensis]|uniref:Uncharacterized protein n=1 Tax=Methanoculleus taiwanensis TaxID=1550565 RepID=A0A498H1Y1_9EURY|nr:hypothetical protein [Methanoculleus taiwanensis]RXE56407.1 hypothetical protein ABH15_10000 [Methanoculleus taiwanensis]
MYSKIRTLSDTLTLNKTSVNLPKDAVIDALILKVSLTIANAFGGAYSGTGLDILKALQEVRVISDGSTVHYALNGKDIAILNAFDGLYGGAAVAADTVSVNDSASTTETYTLILNEGDILAVTKDSLELKAVFDTTITTGVTVSAATITVSISENVYTPEEFVAKYGANLEAAAEPKVYALVSSVAANTELSGVLDLPTGTLHRRGVMTFTDASGVYGSAEPSNVGLVVTSPDRRELLNVDWATLRGIGNFKYCVAGAAPAGCAIFNYAQEVSADGYGLRGWRWTKGDYQFSVKTANAGTLRYISCEHVVNARAFEAAERAMIEGTAGF